MKQTAVVCDLFRDKKDHQNDGVMARVTPGMPLAMACAGEKVRIISLAGGRGMQQRLASMGLNVGSDNHHGCSLDELYVQGTALCFFSQHLF